MRAMRGGGGKILNGEKEGLLKRVSGASIFQHPQFHTCSGHLCAPYLKGKPKPFVLRKRIKAVAAPPLMPDGPALSFARSHTLSPSLTHATEVFAKRTQNHCVLDTGEASKHIGARQGACIAASCS